MLLTWASRFAGAIDNPVELDRKLLSFQELLTVSLRKKLSQLARDVGLSKTPHPIDDGSNVWSKLLSRHGNTWKKAVAKARGGPRVVLATSTGGYSHGSLLESTLAVALTLRGAEVEFALCDGILPGCQMTKFSAITPEELAASKEQPRCGACMGYGKRLYEPLSLPIHWFSQCLTREQREQACHQAMTIACERIPEAWEGLAVGEHAVAGALRYFARGNFEGEPQSELILRRYYESALLTTFAARGLLERFSPEVAVFHHGLYVPQGILGEVFRQNGVRVVNWNPAYRKHCFVLSHQDTYHHTMISEPVTEWESLDWSPQREQQLLAYLASRRNGTNDWIWFHDQPDESFEAIVKEIGLDVRLPYVALLTNVAWDAQLHYSSNAFSSMFDWVMETIEYFRSRPEMQLVIRIHPAELRGAIPSRQPLVEQIEGSISELPKNVFIVAPESQVSTYALADHCNAAIIYNTKTGIEVASLGIPVIVAGEAWIRGKGFSEDATTPDQYFTLLDRLPFQERLSSAKMLRARKYAYHFFFRRMIPVPFFEHVTVGNARLNLESLEELAPGACPGLDVMCEGILEGSAFALDEPQVVPS